MTIEPSSDTKIIILLVNEDDRNFQFELRLHIKYCFSMNSFELFIKAKKKGKYTLNRFNKKNGR